MATETTIVIRAKNLTSRAFKGLTGTLDRLRRSVFNLKTAFVSLGGALLVRSLVKTSSEFENLRIQLNALQGSAAAGEKALAWVKDFAETTPLSLQEVTRSFVTMRAFGLDPMAGQMLKLVDASSKLGGGAERLTSIVRAVGQMFTKGKIQAEEMNRQLTEVGVPAWDLLSKKMGLNISVLQEMSAKGELGRKEVLLLVDAIGEFGDGAALANMKTFTGLFSNFKDQVSQAKDEFTRAKNGLFDFVKAGLDVAIKKLQKFRKDGSLAKWGRDLGFTLLNAVEKVLLGSQAIISALKPIFTIASKGINAVIKVFNALPPWMQAVGVVGAFFLGPAGSVAIIAAIGLTDTLIQKLSRVKDIAPKTRPNARPNPRRRVPLGPVTPLAETSVGKFLERAKEEALERGRSSKRRGNTAFIKSLSRAEGGAAALTGELQKTTEAAGNTKIALIELAQGVDIGISKPIALIRDIRTELLGDQQEALGRKILEEAQSALPKGDEGSGVETSAVFSQVPLGPEEDVVSQIKAEEALLAQIEADAAAAKTEAMLREIEAEQTLADRIREIQISKFDLSEMIAMREGQLAEMQRLEDVGVEQTAQSALRKFEIEQKLAKDVEALERMKTAARKQNFQTAINLSNALFIFGGQKSKALFKITKALNLAEATTSGISAVQKAWSSAPFPANLPAVASTVAATALNISRIKATQFGGGGGVGGAIGGGGGGGTPLIGARPSGPDISSIRNQQARPQIVKIFLNGNFIQDIPAFTREQQDHIVELVGDTV